MLLKLKKNQLKSIESKIRRDILMVSRRNVLRQVKNEIFGLVIIKTEKIKLNVELAICSLIWLQMREKFITKLKMKSMKLQNDQLKQVRNQVYYLVYNRVRDLACDQVLYPVFSQVQHQIGDRVIGQVQRQVYEVTK